MRRTSTVLALAALAFVLIVGFAAARLLSTEFVVHPSEAQFVMATTPMATDLRDSDEKFVRLLMEGTSLSKWRYWKARRIIVDYRVRERETASSATALAAKLAATRLEMRDEALLALLRSESDSSTFRLNSIQFGSPAPKFRDSGAHRGAQKVESDSESHLTTQPVAKLSVPVAGLGAQSRSATIAIGRAELFGEGDYSLVRAVAELTDGSLLVADARERRLDHVRHSPPSTVAVSRSGGGPREYQGVGPLFVLLGDTVLMRMSLTRRWLVVVSGTAEFTLAPDARLQEAVGEKPVVGADRTGVFYFLDWEAPRPGSRVLSAADSSQLFSVDWKTGRSLAVTNLRRAVRVEMLDRNARTGVSRQSTSQHPLQVGEQATSFPDGWLAVARLDPYRVDWRSPDGLWRLGEPLPVVARRFDATERKAFRTQVLEDVSRQFTSNIQSEERRLVEAAVDASLSLAPEFYPPFTMSALFTAPSGSLLLERPRARGDTLRSYDVVNRQGRLEGRLFLDSGERLVGSGAEFVFTVKSGLDGQEILHRRRWPK